MKNFKTADFCISVALILYYSLIALPFQIGFSDFILIEGYIVVGAWQSISMIIHAITNHFTQKWSERFIYHWISFIAVITMPAGSIWILIFIAPLMAVYYTRLCYVETFIKMKRPMELLK
jgi:hypothetical protein